MKKQFSEEQLDGIMARLVEPDEELVDQIADSPQLWWAVQSNIAREKESTVSPWPPIQKIWRWLAIGTPIAAGLVIAAIWFVASSPIEQPLAVNELPVVGPPAGIGVDTIEDDLSVLPDQGWSHKSATASHKTARAQRALPKTVAKRTTPKPVEIKTDFIALTYAQAPASGQIVRVQVPSAMMVSLGLMDSVKKPSQLVDAEVVLGDDGMTHAIRFIRNQ